MEAALWAVTFGTPLVVIIIALIVMFLCRACQYLYYARVLESSRDSRLATAGAAESAVPPPPPPPPLVAPPIDYSATGAPVGVGYSQGPMAALPYAPYPGYPPGSYQAASFPYQPGYAAQPYRYQPPMNNPPMIPVTTSTSVPKSVDSKVRSSK